MGISSAPLAYTDPGITLNVANMNRIFGQGFSERFPEMAKGYGLTVSPTAPAILTVTMTSGLSKCPSWCATTFQVEGVLKDLGGNLMWTMSAKVTIGSYDKTGTEHVGLAFDQLAHEWLEAMKKQGVIG